MSALNNMKKTFDFRFVDAPSKVVVELTNASEKTLKSIEVLTIFLKDNHTPGGPSQAHIRFDGVRCMQPGEKTILSHRTWINGKPADADHDQMERLKLIAAKPTLMHWRFRGRMLRARCDSTDTAGN